MFSSDLDRSLYRRGHRVGRFDDEPYENGDHDDNDGTVIAPMSPSQHKTGRPRPPSVGKAVPGKIERFGVG
jgi:hypothetical protein